jgi:hypothetical protein
MASLPLPLLLLVVLLLLRRLMDLKYEQQQEDQEGPWACQQDQHRMLGQQG